ncbi:MAG: type IX secretion system membrane protein PorP/SprF [Bacteroidales bacterium]|nr:type IX secretion system membrane protein PorP/SprF [Bacteroidales bacterium]
MRKIYKILFFLLIPIGASGQLAPVTNQYVLNPLSINPAYAGSRGALNIAALYRRQWVGITGAPNTMTLAADAPFFDEKVGLGLIIMNDKVGVTKETQIISNYAYRLSLKEGSLSFGLGAGITTTNTAWSDLVVLDKGDELYLNNSRLFVVPNVSFGTCYSNNNYYLGFSIPKIFSYKFNLKKNKYDLLINPGQTGYLFTGGYIFSVSPKLKFFPSSLLTFTPREKILFDINTYFNYIDRFWFGVSYRSTRSFAGLFQFQVNNQLKVAYTYDFDFSKLRTYSNGSHEIMLRYEFRYKVDVVNPLIF